MSTRGIVKFYKKTNMDNTFQLAIYNHWDSYPSGLGKNIFEFLDNIKIVNGFNPTSKIFDIANGYDDLMLQFVIWLKNDGVGNVYLAEEDYSEEYDYIITYDIISHLFKIKVLNYGDEVFSGSLSDFGKWVNKNNS